MQIMSVLTGCVDGARATGLVDPNVRSDAYTACTALMGKLLGTNLTNSRKAVKQAVMTYLYGSKKEPKMLFGEDTKELHAFHNAMYKLAPGACELLTGLIDTWRPFALRHSWQLPDGGDVIISVMEQKKTRIEVDELAGTTFSYIYNEVEGKERDVKNAANIVHSVDAYVLRSLIRRCSYDIHWTTAWQEATKAQLLERHLGGAVVKAKDGKEPKLMKRYEASAMADITILDGMSVTDLDYLSDNHLLKLESVLSSMLENHPFPIITIHDDFKAHANNLNHLRKHYRNILAEMAESELLSDLMSQLYETPVTIRKKSTNLPTFIRNSNYGIC
jgi:hypothetical protein